MAKRYSKFHSNYIIRKKHQESTKGTIWERDWVTIGAQHQIEKGKRVFYGDTNFLFTDNTYNSYKKRHKFSKWVAEWTYDEAVENASPEVNIVTTNWESNDLRDFAYYGSCVELIKNTIFDIVKWFPGRMTKSSDKLYVGEKYADSETNFYTEGYILNNPFELDLYRNIFDQKTDENPLRYVYDTYNEYQINGEDIAEYEVHKIDNDCIIDITKLCEITILTTYNKLYFIDGYYTFGDIIYVEGNSPYIKYYTKVDDETNEFDRIYPYSFGPFTDIVYIHRDDVDNIYVLAQEYEVVDSEPYILISRDELEYSLNGTFIFNDITYYRWTPGDVQDPTLSVYTLEEVPKPPCIGYFYSIEENDMISTGFDVIDYKTSRIVQNDTLSVKIFDNYDPKYSIYDYKNGDSTISIEEYEELSEEDQSAYTPRYYWTLSAEEYMNFDSSVLEEGTYFTINILDDSKRSIEPFFGEIGSIVTLQEYPDNVTNYVNSLRGVAHMLLNNKTNPLYRATIITPIETETGYIYTEKFYTWPSTNGYIDVSSALYHQYMDSLIDMATIFDDTWCDNLWRNMTHESIRNFDWSYKKDYVEGDENAFVEGGIRMQDIIHIYGRIADELKRYIEGFKMTTTITTDGYNNMPDAEISDKLEYRGWDVYSTIPVFEDVTITNEDISYEDEEVITYDGETIPEETTEDVKENSTDYSTVMIDEGFIKTYIQKQHRTINHIEYLNLPEESRAAYECDYIRVDYVNREDNETYNKYDAIGPNVISPQDYDILYENIKNTYNIRWQNVIKTVDEYNELGAEEQNNYEPYQYRNKYNYNDIIGAEEYTLTRWAEDYMPKLFTNEDGGITATGYCRKKVNSNGEITCAANTKIITENEYNKLRSGKDKYEIYVYRRKDDVIRAADIENIGGNIEGYQPYSIIVDEYGVFPITMFYPYEYERINNDLFRIGSEVDLSDENSSDDVVLNDFTERMTVYNFNRVIQWQEDYFVYEYFKPTDQENWMEEANKNGLERYTWETVKELKDNESDEFYEMFPYRLINKKDNDTILTPEQWTSLPKRSDWQIISYKCTANEDILLTVEEFEANVYEYRKLNVVTDLYYATLSEKEKGNFAPYNVRELNRFDRWFNAKNFSAETMAEQDIRFVKELMMMSREMFTTKGTKHGVDMIMSMFGFGPDTYTLSERYHRIDLGGHIYSDEVYSKLKIAATYDETSIYTDFDEDFEEGTVPMGTTELHGVKYIIPYYDNKKSYAGEEVYFQAKGGWGAKPYLNSNNTIEYEYMETLSYLRVVESIGDLLNVNARTVNNGDIYYVMSLLDMVEYDKNPENEALSHFFYIEDDFNPHLYRSWVNIDMTANETEDGIMGVMAKKAKYLDSIISTSLGNNPHTGYGKYDLGERFVEYMKKPFKYYLDNYVIDADTRNIMDGDDATYTLVTTVSDDPTCKVKDITEREIHSRFNVLSKTIIEDNRYVDDYDLRHRTDDDYALSRKQYYINDKTLIMTNKINNNLYKKYFFDVIVHYLMQMIPSTTILILENFNIDNGDS